MSDTCGCCEGEERRTPASTANRPGLSQIAYRAGSHADFLEAMLARLTSHALPSGERPLQRLGTRATDDPAIALLDAWACVADVLTFYQERIANEGYLRTASERRSLLELGRLVGYRMRPGVAASVYLAYEMEPGVLADAEIPAGSRAQSVPGPGELPQSFETSAPIKARTRWNAISPRQTKPQLLTRARFAEGGTLYLKGISTNLKPNAPFLLAFSDGEELYRIMQVTPEPLADRTALLIQPWLESADTSARAMRLRELAVKYADLERFDVEDTKTAQEPAFELTRLAVAAGMSAPEVVRAFRGDLLPRLRTTLAEVEERKYSRLSAWLQELVDDFAAALEERGVAESPSSSQPSISRLLRKLELSPASPPASRQQLSGGLKDAFAAGSQSAAAMLGALRPGLAPALYAGWSSLPVGSGVAVAGHALRAQAGVFGASAPQKVSMPGPDGGPLTYDDWDLKLTPGPAFEVDFSLVVSYVEGSSSGSPDTATRASVQVRLGKAQSDLQTIELPTSASQPAVRSITLGGERVELALSYLSPEEGNDYTEGYLLTVRFVDREAALAGRERAPEMMARFVDREAALAGRERAPELMIGLSLGRGVAAFAGSGLVIRETMADSTVVDEGNDETPVLRGLARGLLPTNNNTEQTDAITLDLPNVAVLPDSYVVVERPGDQPGVGRLVIGKALQSKEVARAAYGISGKGTQVLLDRPWLAPGDDFGTLRGATVYAASERLDLAEEPIADPVCGGEIELDGLYDGLESGRWLIVAGERFIKGVRGVTAAELVMISGVRHGPRPGKTPPPGETTHTTIILAGDLGYSYVRSSLKIYANVAPATHGETRREILGAGDGARALQGFGLRFAPLTYVPAATPSGVASTLDVYVNDVRWREAPSLARLGPADRSFVTRQDNEHQTSLTFGSGQRGARLPSGRENVRAVYRNGLGKAGNVAAGAISLLASRPLGVKGVQNPLAASGGADPETGDQAREHLPLAVAALDRLVSVQDYEDFARSFAGIAKASARRLLVDRRPLVHITIAGADDIPIAPTSGLFQSLRAALLRYGDPALPLRVALRERVALVASAGVAIDPDYVWEQVEPEIRRRLLELFSFGRRALGQDALLSELIAAAQAVPGVRYIDVDSFDGVSELTADAGAEGGRRLRSPDEFTAAVLAIADAASPRQRVPAQATLAERPAAGGPTMISPAQIALLLPAAPDTLILRRLPL